MKKLFTVFCVLCLLFMTGCSSSAGAEDTINSFFNALESGDLAKAETYTDSVYADQLENFMSSISDTDALDFGIDSSVIDTLKKQVMKAVFQKHTVTSIEEDGDHATAVVSVTGLNTEAIETLFNDGLDENVLTEMYSIYAEKGQIAALQYAAEELIDLLKNKAPSLSTTYESTVEMIKEDSQWVITAVSE